MRVGAPGLAPTGDVKSCDDNWEMKMGDFERTFGAGADAVAIVEGFSRAAAREPDLEKASCFKCNGIGRIRRYKHIEGGRCFSCNGTGLVWLDVKRRIKSEHEHLQVTLQQIKDRAPTHDSFGDLGPAFRKSFAMLTSALGEPFDLSTRVSIGDVAKAFGPSDAIGLALHIPRVDRKSILRIAVLAAERAAEATKEQSLSQAVSDVRKRIDQEEDTRIIQRGPLRTPSDPPPVVSAKYCRDFLIRMTDKDADENPHVAWKFVSFTMSYACAVFGDLAQAQGADGKEESAAEKKRQISDIIAISPLSALRS